MILRSAMVVMMSGCRSRDGRLGVLGIIIVIVGMFLLLLPDGVLHMQKEGGGLLIGSI